MITNQDTYRNFSVTADYCCVGSKVLSQLEIEYKGRSGNWLPIPDYEAIIKEYDALNTILRTYYSCQIGRSFQTKFDWLAKENYITGREIDGI